MIDLGFVDDSLVLLLRHGHARHDRTHHKWESHVDAEGYYRDGIHGPVNESANDFYSAPKANAGCTGHCSRYGHVMDHFHQSLDFAHMAEPQQCLQLHP